MFGKNISPYFFTVLFLLVPLGINAQEAPSPITRSRDLQLSAEEYREIFLSFTPQERKRLLQDDIALKDFLTDFHAATVLANRARAMHLDQDPRVRAQIEVKTRSILANELRTRYLESLPMPDFQELAKEFYLAHREDLFSQPEAVKVAHILIKPDPCTRKQAGPKAAWAEAEEKAAAILEELKGGADFSELAKKYSEDPTAVQGGLINRWAKSGTFVPSFEKAAFALKAPGDLSEPVRTRYGFHIIKLIAHRPAQPMPFEQVKGRVLKTVRKNYVMEKAQEYLGPTYADPRYLDLEQARQLLRELDASSSMTSSTRTPSH